MTEKPFDFDQMRADMVNDAFRSGKRFSKIKPEDQIAQWLKLGLYHAELLQKEGKEPKITAEDIRQFDVQGGTDHLDPTLTNYHSTRDVH